MFCASDYIELHENRTLPHQKAVGEPDCAPEISPARGPPELYLELDQCQIWDIDAVDSTLEFEYDQAVSW